MKWAALPALFLAVSCSESAPPPPPDPAANRYQVWELVTRFHEAADRADVDAMLEFMASDVSMYKGKDAFARKIDKVEAVLSERAERVEEGQSTLLGQQRIVFNGQGAVCSYVANVGVKRGAITMVLRYQDKKWLILHLHESWPDP